MHMASWDQDEVDCSDDVPVSPVAHRVNAVLGHIAGSAWILGLLAVAKLAGMKAAPESKERR